MNGPVHPCTSAGQLLPGNLYGAQMAAPWSPQPKSITGVSTPTQTFFHSWKKVGAATTLTTLTVGAATRIVAVTTLTVGADIRNQLGVSWSGEPRSRATFPCQTLTGYCLTWALWFIYSLWIAIKTQIIFQMTFKPIKVQIKWADLLKKLWQN